MEELVNIVKIVSDAGASVMLVGLLGFYIYKHFIHRNKEDEYELERKKQQDKDAHDAMMRSFDLISTMVVDKMKEDHFKEEPINFNINNKIVETMTELMSQTNASRVLHFSYHNGGKDYEGRNYQRMSCINEVVANDVIPIQSKYSNMFRTSMFYLYQELSEKGFFNIEDIDNISKKDPGTHHMLIQDDILSSFGCVIKNKNGEPTGFIMLCFDKPETETKNIVSLLKKYVHQIEGIYLVI